ncbi:MAG TPA: ATP-binding protein [Candidatus Saccharimonadia bacterium]|nr:ATP-binding protein [Candidatus Saccharimonadia bacterium]
MLYRPLAKMRSYGNKVRWLVTLSSGLAIVVVASGLSLLSYRDVLVTSEQELATLAALVSTNASAPLEFGDRIYGAEALAALSSVPAVGAAALHDADGREFATYRRENDPPPKIGLAAPGLTRSGRWHVHTTPIAEGERALGRLQIVQDLAPMYRHLVQNLLLALMTAIAAMALVWLASRRLRDALIAPVDELGRAARQVSSTDDYSVRAKKLTEDEMGDLADAFNAMLARIERQSAEVRAAREEAELASRMKDEFLATLSHELRTPMTPILGWAQILKRTGSSDPRALQAADVIERNAHVQMRIVDDLLDMSRIVSGKVSIELRAVDLAEVVEAAISTVHAAAVARGITIETRIDPQLPLVHGDPNRLQQIVWNLVSNAIKFNREGGSVRIDLRRVGDRAVLGVEDTGHGIEPEFLPHVFERFRQADSSSTRSHSGLGLGLAIVRQLVHLHGGTVSAASEGTNRGARFVVELRFAPQQHASGEVSAQREPESASLAGLRVLVVDDEPDARELIATLATGHGAEVVTAESADAAVRLLATFEADVLVSDIGMPERDGYALLSELRGSANERLRHLPAIALTAFARASDRERALQTGFNAHLAKPIEHDSLIATIARVNREGGVAGPSPLAPA